MPIAHVLPLIASRLLLGRSKVLPLARLYFSGTLLENGFESEQEVPQEGHKGLE